MTVENLITVVKYEPRIVDDHRIVVYAVTEKGDFAIPEAFRDMCDNEHLALRYHEFEIPELFGMTENSAWLPAYTGDDA